jgi:hypothetical protein
METLKVFANVTTSGNAVAQVVIPSKSRIKGVQWSIMGVPATGDLTVEVELSRASASQIGVNGAQQSISQCGVTATMETSGNPQTAVAFFHPVDVPVIQGQIIYLHAFQGTGTASVTCIIHYA